MADYSALALPPLLSVAETKNLALPCDAAEQRFLVQARKLLDGGFYDHALLDIWNASVHNLRRRVEDYGADMFVSVVKEESGRKRYDPTAETLPERWAGVDDLVLIAGSSKLGLLSKKAAKVLETINWMRNHASAAHATEDQVGLEDVAAFAVVLQKNLFEVPLPDPGHSVASIFDPVKLSALDPTALDLVRDQVRSLRPQDLRTCFGFLLDLIAKGTEPGFSNAKELMPVAWELAAEDLRKVAGARFHTLTIAPASDDSPDKGARLRYLELLVRLAGVKYVPDAVRAQLFRDAARRLGSAKDTAYGWAAEELAARSLAELGVCVPSIAFEEVYQEIIAVWCGNFWGRSNAHDILAPFMNELSTLDLLRVVRLFDRNQRVQAELSNSKPRARAVALLDAIEERLTLAAHKGEVTAAKAKVATM